RHAVLRPAGMIARPAVRVCRAPRVGDLVGQRLPPHAQRAEVEPLIEIRILVARDFESHAVVEEGGQADVAAIEGGGDADRHFTVIVRPDSPGKPTNSAWASLVTAACGEASGDWPLASVIARP